VDDVWVWVAVVWVACGAVGALIAEHKNQPRFGGFALGVLLGVFGIAIAAILPTQLPGAPEGMYPLRCPRCNAVQNVPYGLDTFVCWQCKYNKPMDAMLGERDADS
jgi:hypothetical protein